MFLSEANQEWCPVPLWVEYLIRFGYSWPSGVLGQRKIGLVSMPCDSAAAGLIALGALIGDLGNPEANNIEGHYDALLRYARQYLQACRKCSLQKCEPKLEKCGYTAEASGRIRSSRHPRKIFTVSPSTDIERRRLAWESPGKGKNGPVVHYPNPIDTIKWQVEGVPPVYESSNDEGLPKDIYQEIIEDAQFISGNLQGSFSGLCLAGRTMGKEATRQTYAAYRFRGKNGDDSLANLLTVNGWTASSHLSRLVYFNSRTESFDRPDCSPALVIADGDVSFLKALSREEFQRSDIIGVMHRTIDRDRLEAVGNRLLGLRQWYEEDFETLKLLPEKPRGIGVSLMTKGAR